MLISDAYNSADVLLAQSSTSYDSLGQVYQSSDYLVAAGRQARPRRPTIGTTPRATQPR